MKIGIFGSEHDAQCQALKAILQKKGVEVIVVESQGLNQGIEAAFDGKDFSYQGKDLSDVGAWYLRYIMSPLPPAFEMEEQYYLYADWFREYMHRRERQGFQLSWLLSLSLAGCPVVNSPEHGSVIQLKPFQLRAAHAVGLKYPKTLITNSPQKVRTFNQEVGECVYKPSMGGGLCQKLDQEALTKLDFIVSAPVIFQQKIEGTSIRLTIIGNELVSSVAIPTEALDYRSDPNYFNGNQTYEQVSVPNELVEQSLKLMRHCGLLFSGLDFIKQKDGSYVFLEANSSPIYLDIEQKTNTPITKKMADYLLRLANEPEWYKKEMGQVVRTKSFVKYAYPFDSKTMV